jgi:hypothetical protein
VCAGALICTSTAPRTCVARGGEGAPCTSGYACLDDLDCNGDTCVRNLRDGDTCLAGGDNPRCTVFCVLESTATNMGVCAVLDALPDPGAPCAYARGRPLCAQGAYPDVVMDSADKVLSCKCSPVLADGAACRNNLMCASGVCGPEDQCRPPYVLGEECPGDFACESGNCAWNEAENVARCEPPLMCN